MDYTQITANTGGTIRSLLLGFDWLAGFNSFNYSSRIFCCSSKLSMHESMPESLSDTLSRLLVNSSVKSFGMHESSLENTALTV